MATVYLAEDLKHDRKVAIKILHPELSAVIGGDRFLSEIKTTAASRTPHPGAHRLGDADGLLYYVMPFIEGETLRARLHREKQLPVDDASATDEGSRPPSSLPTKRGIVHRDIKPETSCCRMARPLVATSASRSPCGRPAARA
jgi:serine/threonine-protein kinase